jgi:hypothetical protein
MRIRSFLLSVRPNQTHIGVHGGQKFERASPLARPVDPIMHDRPSVADDMVAHEHESGYRIPAARARALRLSAVVGDL